MVAGRRIGKYCLRESLLGEEYETIQKAMKNGDYDFARQRVEKLFPLVRGYADEIRSAAGKVVCGSVPQGFVKKIADAKRLDDQVECLEFLAEALRKAS